MTVLSEWRSADGTPELSGKLKTSTSHEDQSCPERYYLNLGGIPDLDAGFKYILTKEVK